MQAVQPRKTFFHISIKALCTHNLEKCIIQRPKIRINLTLQISRQESSFSPASIAGLVRIILLTSLFLNALIAIAIARYVLPVPAGPTPNTIILSLIASTYSFCPNVLGLIGLPAIVLHTVSESISISESAFSSNDCAME